ncbi:MAG: hypothetical protein EPN88_13060 [Bacteroidetes bacterium]|nr:MAG: hypothetical protein EPN88_13060 [Bacteroidota bacterium]
MNTNKQKNIFMIFPLLFLLSLQLSCNKPTEPENLPPGRRDYVWTVDTLDGLNSPRFRMWGSSPSDVWATTTSNWDVSISHFDGRKWSSYGIPGIIQPKGIYGFSNTSILIGESAHGKVWQYSGNGWMLSAQLLKDGHKNIWIENIWGQSINDFYTIGAYPDEQGLANKSVIAHYNKGDWTILNTEKLSGVVEHLYKNQSDNKIYLQLIKVGGLVHVDSTIIYEYKQEKFENIYSSLEIKGLQSDISLINGEVYFILGNEIATRRNNQFQKVMEVNNPNFYQRIWGRNSKDIFLLMTDGLAHYNGENIEYLFYFTVTPRTQIFGAALFEKEVFFLVDEAQTGLSLVYHGILK